MRFRFIFSTFHVVLVLLILILVMRKGGIAKIPPLSRKISKIPP
jgi:hypothetical protein